MHVTHHQGNRFFHSGLFAIVELATKPMNAEFAPAGGKLRRGYLLYRIRTHVFIIAIRCVVLAYFGVAGGKGAAAGLSNRESLMEILFCCTCSIATVILRPGRAVTR